MYGVLIAEDEILVRLGLKNIIDWHKFDMTIVADVGNGQEAWDAYLRYKPDLVITDIRMPVMDGFELIKKIRNQDTDCKIIILTCVEDFDMVRKAMSYKVSEYISKLEMNRAQMEEIIGKTYQELIIRNNDQQRNNHAIVASISEKEAYLRRLMIGDSSGKSDWIVDNTNMNLKIPNGLMCICLIELHKADTVHNNEGQASHDFSNQIAFDTVRSVVMSLETCECMQDTEKRMVIIANNPSAKSSDEVLPFVVGVIEHIKKLIANYIGITVAVGISSVCTGYENLNRMYQEARQSLQFGFCYGLNGVYVWTAESLREYRLEIQKRVQEKKVDLIKSELVNSALYTKLQIIVDNFTEGRIDSELALYKLFFQLMYWHSVETSITGMDVSGLLMEYQRKLIECEILDALFSTYDKYIVRLQETMKKRKNISKEIREAIRYIESRCGENLTLQQVSSYISLSPNYMSSLFKKELQLSFVEYLTSIRVQKAKLLLLETNDKMYEIASKTGFADEAYFSRIFKKLTGKSPVSFRRQNHSSVLEDIGHENP